MDNRERILQGGKVKTYEIYIMFGERLGSMSFYKQFRSYKAMTEYIKSLGVKCIPREV